MKADLYLGFYFSDLVAKLSYSIFGGQKTKKKNGSSQIESMTSPELNLNYFNLVSLSLSLSLSLSIYSIFSIYF